MQAIETNPGFDPVEERIAAPRLLALGLQHVLVMYAGAIAVPLIVGRALQLSPQDVAFLISADLFVCGVVTIIQSFGATQWFGIRLPVMMGVTFAAVGPMVAIAQSYPGQEGARMMFGAIMAAGIIAIFLAPVVGRMLRFFPSVVTGTVILVIGISLMPVGINWIFGLQVGPTAPKLIDPAHKAWLDAAITAGGVPEGLKLAPTVKNPEYASLSRILIGVVVLGSILLIARYAKGFIANIAVLMGILIGGVLAAALGLMHFGDVAGAAWFAPIAPLHFGMPIFDPIMILTMVLVMMVIMIESTGMFLALSDLCGRRLTPKALTAGLRVDGLGTAIGGLFNTFPYTSFSQNVGLVGVTGVRSRFVCVAGGAIMIVLGLIPKMAVLVESLPTTVLGGAGLVMFGMVAATGIRILSTVDFKGNRHNLFIVAVSLGLGMIPMIAPDFNQWLPHSIHTLIHSGILLAAVAAVLLNWFFNGAPKVSDEELAAAAHAAEAH
ncbi:MULTISPECIES: nucleobase:cation symporter-2 family protein [unclassified Paracoccus (in: a-proteobacteria)]|uniref:nucleobase:cation symporter-2 family protein n=1 Tax=unclassified Paracoccus (in: a-proteobacteria) TaxID=2688777 RepID=UPI0012B43D34|nr:MULTISPECIES: nucleobase:cation symporter-2 family protein [unclassified Paracoccus (in: a-proteobacteria)]UXU76473.1 purine permease [Paracoccus sp. SMMA_5]UXU82189.1 purine permease [Paracoccus sp. SMMA_5_TC]